ncbi:hypothetical protein [Polyangium fumosum]|uniref:Lipoprotein n=1 Tax=Polyangium fumosum TaxID=889272 RepID=A0A4U1IQL0_9BACT|nr:hypothetical protein [Polyangium fumosum]TKC96525.1 hypothetical protein E8A74_45145 [Polyangium fumosum]
MARKAKGQGQRGKPCALLVATLVGTLSGCGPQLLHRGEKRFLFVRLRAGDGRAIAGMVDAPRSATPEVCTLAPVEKPERAREVLEFNLPHARDYQRSAWELRAQARGTCRVEARVGEVVAQALVEVD